MQEQDSSTKVNCIIDMQVKLHASHLSSEVIIAQVGTGPQCMCEACWYAALLPSEIYFDGKNAYHHDR